MHVEAFIYIGLIAVLLGQVWWLSQKCDKDYWRGYVQGQRDHSLGINMAKDRDPDA